LIFLSSSKKEILRSRRFVQCDSLSCFRRNYLNVFGQSLTGDAEMEKALYFMVGVGGNSGNF